VLDHEQRPRMTALRGRAIALALATAGLASVGCNALTGLDRNYVEVDCFPLPSCPDSSMHDGASSMPDEASSNADSLERTMDSRGEADAVGPDGDAGDAGAPDGDAAGPDAVESGPNADSALESGNDGASCTDSCASRSTRCSVDGVPQTCERMVSGCTQWVSGANCGAHQSCIVANGAASCACSASQCTQVGTACQDSQTLATCAKDASGCYYVDSTSTCVMPKSCSGMLPGALCSTTCTSSCTQGQTSCINGGLATCALGSNGCLSYGGPAACGPHQSCTGAAGAAACTCNADPVCSAPGNACANSTTLATCSKDAQNCLYQSGSTACSNGVCSGAACCTNNCTQGQTSCINGALATCALGASGCWSYGVPAACGAHQSCTGAVGSASCTCNTDPVCGAPGNLCANSTTLATCSRDAQNCVYESASTTCANGACSAGSCCTNACSSSATQCTSPTSSQECKIGSNGCLQWAAKPCSASICSNGACVTPPSCQPGGAGMTDCGATKESCCTSLEVPGGLYNRTYGGGASGDPATVSAFRLDKYSVTVGRFRQFVNAWNAGYLPAAGTGKHTHLNGGQGLANAAAAGFEPGWVTSDGSNVTPTDLYLGNETWSHAPGNQENKPIKSVNWFEAYAFCVWDGGFLPSEAEWEFAAAGGSQQRMYPWGSDDPGTMNRYAIYGCYYPNSSGNCAGTAPDPNIAPVGTATFGAGLWGQLDLAGEVENWVLDADGPYVTPCTDCAYLPVQLTAGRVLRGTDHRAYATTLVPTNRDRQDPTAHSDAEPGVRCARLP